MGKLIDCGICDLRHDVTDEFFVGCITALKRRQKETKVIALKEIVQFKPMPNGELVIYFKIEGKEFKVGRLDPDQIEEQKALLSFLSGK